MSAPTDSEAALIEGDGSPSPDEDDTPLARFTVAATEREIVAVRHGAALRLVDRRLDAALGERDEREVEPRLTSIEEARAVAEDYARLSRDLGRSAMPEAWW